MWRCCWCFAPSSEIHQGGLAQWSGVIPPRTHLYKYIYIYISNIYIYVPYKSSPLIALINRLYIMYRLVLPKYIIIYIYIHIYIYIYDLLRTTCWTYHTTSPWHTLQVQNLDLCAHPMHWKLLLVTLWHDLGYPIPDFLTTSTIATPLLICIWPRPVPLNVLECFCLLWCVVCVVWFDVVWCCICCAVRCCAVLCWCVVRHGVAWWGGVWCGVMWCGVAWCGSVGTGITVSE